MYALGVEIVRVFRQVFHSFTKADNQKRTKCPQRLIMTDSYTGHLYETTMLVLGSRYRVRTLDHLRLCELNRLHMKALCKNQPE